MELIRKGNKFLQAHKELSDFGEFKYGEFEHTYKYQQKVFTYTEYSMRGEYMVNRESVEAYAMVLGWQEPFLTHDRENDLVNKLIKEVIQPKNKQKLQGLHYFGFIKDEISNTYLFLWASNIREELLLSNEKSLN